MKYLGIDFGLANIGLAFAEGPLAEPLGEKRYQHQSQIFKYLVQLCQKQRINTIVIGISENTMAQKTRNFGRHLATLTGLPVKYQDETLTTKIAKQKLISAHAPQKKRRQNHRIAATLILQSYLDTLS